MPSTAIDPHGLLVPGPVPVISKVIRLIPEVIVPLCVFELCIVPVNTDEAESWVREHQRESLSEQEDQWEKDLEDCMDEAANEWGKCNPGKPIDPDWFWPKVEA